MNKKDIALTVGGVLATMVVAYLIYKMQQRDAATTSAQAQAASDQAAQDAANAQQADASANYQYAELMQQATTPSVTGTTASTPAAVSSSSTTAITGGDGTTYDSTNIDTLLGQIINDYAAPLMPSSTVPNNVASMTIPTLAGVGQADLSGIPLTAAAAAAGAATPGVTNFDSSGSPILNGAYPIAMQSSSAVSSHPVEAHPIVTTGS